MVNIANWDEFQALAQDLFLSDVSNTRYSFKYRDREGTLVLKVTNDRKCLKFSTVQRADVAKMERFTDWMLKAMSSAVDDDKLAEVVD
eukprot:CAMPEP_0198346142 /NCGR_PEP_ID=MMETSP1450-20131203/77917_1 /TAXON_ID=753684 ORGANISM="Madagascaria erythrocladiodes, Strain CCMP3234" /NCGR_SAMPLE_ID=MMETSP1450 /ASSEMBLY_ACC=CAM_ASM_001115 /LENGTH=87 /DNA_ID=CAMNT_0044051549 /DNA_START=88 /DNA_END=351 /DNA_ORIENTATION=+